MRIAAIIALSMALSAPAIAEEVIIQTPNPYAADRAAGAARVEHRDAQFDQHQARVDQSIANRDAATGHYNAARAAEGAARDERQDAHIDNSIARHDMTAARRDDTTRIQIIP